MPDQITAGLRPPIVAIVGHIDHGKSTLLDYIRRTNVVEGEAGGITQHLSAYEAEHKNETGVHRITFLDTPGHEAFSAMRSRGLEVADVAILVVSSEDGVKPQTLEALKLINEVKIPFIVAFTKIDKPSANIERAKMSLLENSIFLEGMGGEVPWVAVSGKSGEGVPELLDLILLAGELEGLTANPEAPAMGVVIEAHVDGKRGNTATLIVLNGSIKSGEYIVSQEATAPVRIMENFAGKKIKTALPGSPAVIVGFSALPQIGAAFKAVESKKEAEEDAQAFRLSIVKTSTNITQPAEGEEELTRLIIPLVIKTDVAGTGEAVLHELDKLPKSDRMEVRIVGRSVGAIGESDVRQAGAGAHPGIIVGFNVKVEREAKELAARLAVKIEMFDVIYKLGEWLGKEIEERRPRAKEERRIGYAKIIKVFSGAKGRFVLGGRVDEGELTRGRDVKVLRKDIEVARGEIVSLQSQKRDVDTVETGSEFGAMIKLSAEPAGGDYLEAFEVVLS